MVVVRRHNPYLRMRNKKNAGGGNPVSLLNQHSLKLVIFGLVAFSLCLAGYLLRRVSQTTQKFPNGADLPAGGAVKTSIAGKNHVHIDTDLAHPHDVKPNRPKLRRPIPDQESKAGSKSAPEEVVSPPSKPHRVEEEPDELPDEEHNELPDEEHDETHDEEPHGPPPTVSPVAQEHDLEPPDEPNEVGGGGQDTHSHKDPETPPLPPQEKISQEKIVDHGAAPENLAAVSDQSGTGATHLGYVKDLAYERAHPAFWQPDTAAWLADRTAKASQIAGTPLQSCTTVEGSLHPVCKDADTMLYAFNPVNFSRTLCGIEVPPRQIVKLDSLTDHDCLKEPARHILPQDVVTASSPGMTAIQVVAHLDGAETAKMQTVQCDVPCSYDVSLMFEDPPRERYIHGEEWKILYDGPESTRPMEKTDYKRDIYYSTASSLSSIPVSTFDFAKYDFRMAPAVEWSSAERAAGYFANEQCSAGGTRRSKWMMAMKVKYPVHAYGTCQHDTDVEDEDLTTMEGRLSVMARNRLVLAFEVSNERDAFTAITWEAFLSGAVPVLVGPSNALQVLPQNSFIWYGTYNSWDKFAEDVAALADDQKAWESYHAWRKDEKELEAFEARMNFTRTSVECRTCRWAFAKMYGLRWDAAQQQIRPSTIPRDKFCLSSHDQLTKPFAEIWSGSNLHGVPQDEDSCDNKPLNTETKIETEEYSVTRQVWHHDGVTDILFSEVETNNADTPIVLKLEFDVKNYEGAYFPHPHTTVDSQNHHLVSSAAMQDYSTRVTVLADWNTTIVSSTEGAFEVVLPSSIEETKRVRVIIEDVDALNFKLTEFHPFSFGKKMILDFTNPIELYYPATARR